MGPWTAVLYVLVVIVSLALIGLILIQPAKGGGLGGSFGGVVGESVFGAYAGSHLMKLTVVLTTILFVLALFLATILGRGQKSIMQSESAAPVESGMAAAVETVVPEAVPETENAAD